MATSSNSDQDAALAAQTVELNDAIDSSLALIEPLATRVEPVAEDGGETIELDVFRVKLSNGEVHDELTDLEALDLAKWWCALAEAG